MTPPAEVCSVCGQACRCNALLDVPAHEWPGVLVTLVRLIGSRATLRLVARFGGQERVMIPKKVTTRHPWRDVLGPEEWERIVRELSGEKVDLPRGSFVFSRKARILDFNQKNVPYREIARRVGTSERYVRMVLAPYKERVPSRRARILDLARMNLPTREIAARVGTTELYVRTVLSSLKGKGRQS